MPTPEHFAIAIGHNVASGSVNNFVPYQPKTPGIQFTRRTPTMDGLSLEGAFIIFTFDLLSQSQLQALWTQAGLTGTNLRRNVTVYCQDLDFAWQYYNGIAVKPVNNTRRGYWFYNVPLLITDLHEVGT